MPSSRLCGTCRTSWKRSSLCWVGSSSSLLFMLRPLMPRGLFGPPRRVFSACLPAVLFSLPLASVPLSAWCCLRRASSSSSAPLTALSRLALDRLLRLIGPLLVLFLLLGAVLRTAQIQFFLVRLHRLVFDSGLPPEPRGPPPLLWLGISRRWRAHALLASAASSVAARSRPRSVAYLGSLLASS